MADVRLLGVPSDWDDDRWITFEDFCKLFELPQRTVRDWKRRGIGPRWTKAPGTGRLYFQIRQVRRFLVPPKGTAMPSSGEDRDG